MQRESIMPTNLKAKVALVTGGSRGIGLAIARRLVAEGMNVSITGRHADSLAAARHAIEGAGPGGVETLQADVRRYDEVAHAIDATASRFGGLDMLVNNAGVGVFADVADLTPEQWREVIDTNLTGVFNAATPPFPCSARRGGGVIINISSLAGKNAVRDGRRVLRVQGRAQRVQRGADAGGPVRRHPGQLRDARVGGDLASRAAARARRRLEDRPRGRGGRRRRPADASRAQPRQPRRAATVAAAQMSSPFDKHHDALERHETMMGPARGRLAVALDLLTDSLALVGQHGVYCRSERFPGRPRMDIALVLEQIDDAKQLVQSAMEELRSGGR